jgi:hypothetical protein
MHGKPACHTVETDCRGDPMSMIALPALPDHCIQSSIPAWACGTYEILSPPDLIVMRWSLEDDNVPLPGQELTGYLRVRARRPRGAHVEVNQLVADGAQAQLMEAAWRTVLGRLKAGVVDASKPDTAMPPRPRRVKRHPT